MDASSIVAWIAAVLSGIATLVVLPLAFYLARYGWDFWRWQRYAKLIRNWAQQELFPDDMADDDWHILAALKLSQAGFEPAKMKDLVELAVWFAKGRARQELRGQIALGRKDMEHGPSDT